jgi:hypothetical protein
MRRALVVLLMIAVATATAAPSAGAAAPRRGFLFSLHADGFGIQGRSALGSGGMRLLLDRHGEVAYYYVRAQVGAGTVRARFGRLGSLDFRFVPGQGEGPLGCGSSEGWQQGAFVGRVVFHGEHDYAHVEADRASGYFQSFPPGGCGRGRRVDAARAGASRDQGARTSARRDLALRPNAGRAGQVAETGARLQGQTGSQPPDTWLYFFTENRPGGVRAVFNALRAERREGMRIERGAQVYGGASTFVWNLGAGTARVEPPAPFSGHAVYRGGAGGGPSGWTGSLRVPIFGGEPIELTGPAFHARLDRGAPEYG